LLLFVVVARLFLDGLFLDFEQPDLFTGKRCAQGLSLGRIAGEFPNSGRDKASAIGAADLRPCLRRAAVDLVQTTERRTVDPVSLHNPSRRKPYSS